MDGYICSLATEKNYTADFEAFCRANPVIGAALNIHRAKTIQYWGIFVQAWKYKGPAGAEAFLSLISTNTYSDKFEFAPA